MRLFRRSVIRWFLLFVTCIDFLFVSFSGAFFNIFFTGFFSFFRFLGLNLLSGLGFKLCCLGRHLPVLPRRLSRSQSYYFDCLCLANCCLGISRNGRAIYRNFTPCCILTTIRSGFKFKGRGAVYMRSCCGEMSRLMCADFCVSNLQLI